MSRLPSFKIQNFHTFDRLEFNPLAQMNLITGKNGARKTSLLESIYLFVNRFSPRLVKKIGELQDKAQEKIYATIFDKNELETVTQERIEVR